MCYRVKDIMEGPRLAGLRMTTDQFFAVKEDDGWKYELIHGVTVPKIYGDDAPRYSGMMMSTDESLKLKDDGHRYEVIDGVVVMSPSRLLPHQLVLSYLSHHVTAFLERRGVGICVLDIDVRFSKNVLYRPDLSIFRKGRLDPEARRVEVVPDLIIEIASRTTAKRDRTTKLADYERFGVSEYLIVDPRASVITAHQLVKGKYQEKSVKQGTWKSTTFAGFSIPIRGIKAAVAPR